MPLMETFTLNLKVEVIQRMQAMVDSGRYANMNDLVEDVLIEDFAKESDDPERFCWFHKEIAARCREADSKPELGLSSEDIRIAVTQEFEEAKRQHDLQAEHHR